jgi:hypothetical protein
VLSLPSGGSYDVYYNTQDNFTTANRSNSELITDTSYTVSGLIENTNYYFWIVARNADTSTSSKPSSSVSGRTINSLITIDFTNPADPVITEIPSVIRQIQKDRYTVEVQDVEGDSAEWRLDGKLYATGKSCEIHWQLPVGSHVLTVVVTKDGIPYSKSGKFNVVNK